jgi:hypothetical protein
MQAYAFEQYVSSSRRISINLPADAPVGLAKIIVLFPDSATTVETQKTHPSPLTPPSP